MSLNNALSFPEIQCWDILFQWQFSELREVSQLVCANIGVTWPITMGDGGTNSTMNSRNWDTSIMRPVKPRFSIVFCLYTTHIFSAKIFLFFFPPFFNSVDKETILRYKHIFGGGGGWWHLPPLAAHKPRLCVYVVNVSTSSCLQHSAVRSYSACAYINWHRLRRYRVLWDVALLS